MTYSIIIVIIIITIIIIFIIIIIINIIIFSFSINIYTRIIAYSYISNEIQMYILVYPSIYVCFSIK